MEILNGNLAYESFVLVPSMLNVWMPCEFVFHYQTVRDLNVAFVVAVFVYCCIVFFAVYVYIIKHYQQRIKNRRARWVHTHSFWLHTKQMPLYLLSVFLFVSALNFALTLSLWSVQEVIINYNIINIFIYCFQVWNACVRKSLAIFHTIFVFQLVFRSLILQQCQRKYKYDLHI